MKLASLSVYYVFWRSFEGDHCYGYLSSSKIHLKLFFIRAWINIDIAAPLLLIFLLTFEKCSDFPVFDRKSWFSPEFLWSIPIGAILTWSRHILFLFQLVYFQNIHKSTMDYLKQKNTICEHLFQSSISSVFLFSSVKVFKTDNLALAVVTNISAATTSSNTSLLGMHQT